mmetsp:Transcript_385/g.886  ORF Transcript_385/g.886 Transcript_385/m.886 type:complete len:357 (+) Transcript_385:809-1879(+)
MVSKQYESFQKICVFVKGLQSCLNEKNKMIEQLARAVNALQEEAIRSRRICRLQAAADVITKGEAASGIRVNRGIVEGSFPTDLIGEGSGTVDALGRDIGYMRFQQLDSRIEDILSQWKGTSAREGSLMNGDHTIGTEQTKDLAEKKTKLYQGSELVFEDVSEPFNKLDSVLCKFKFWKDEFYEEYKTCFVELALPDLVWPYISFALSRCHLVEDGVKELECLKIFFCQHPGGGAALCTKHLVPHVLRYIKLGFDPICERSARLIAEIIKLFSHASTREVVELELAACFQNEVDLLALPEFQGDLTYLYIRLQKEQLKQGEALLGNMKYIGEAIGTGLLDKPMTKLRQRLEKYTIR